MGYSTITRILIALLVFLIPGILFSTCGYRYKDAEFWLEGFLAGFVILSAILTFVIVYFGVCRGHFLSTCDYRWTFLVVFVLSGIWATVVVYTCEKVEIFFGGFDLGCIMGACIYFWHHYEILVGLFMDAEAAKQEVAILLVVAIISGVVVGAATLFFERHAIVFSTSVIGGAMIMASFLILCPLVNAGHNPSWGDLIGWI